MNDEDFLCIVVNLCYEIKATKKLTDDQYIQIFDKIQRQLLLFHKNDILIKDIKTDNLMIWSE